MDFEIRAPPEIVAALRDGHRSAGWVGAYCPVCDPDQRKRGKRTLRAGILRGRPWWGCMRCHCEKDFAAARRDSFLKFQHDQASGAVAERRKQQMALDIIERSVPFCSDDPVDLYLRRRGLPHNFPSDLRRARIEIPRHALPPGTKRVAWAMVAVIRNSASTAASCHRIFVHEDGRRLDDRSLPDSVRLASAKFMLGPTAGCAIRLGIDSESICVAEGIESALGLADATGLVGWAALSAGGMRSLVIPGWIRKIVIGPDLGDKQDVGITAALQLRQRSLDQGRAHGFAMDTTIRPPPLGFCDWGDAGIPRGRRR